MSVTDIFLRKIESTTKKEIGFLTVTMDITSLEFGILSAAEVLSLSVCEVKYEKQKKASCLDNTLYDPRMGPIEDDVECPTCGKTMVDCPGHFGHIVLNEHIIYPLAYGYKTVLNFLKCFCFKCSRLIFSPEKLELFGFDTLKGTKRYNAIVLASAKVEICWSCNAQVAKFFVQNPNKDPKIVMFYKLVTEKKSKENNMEVAVQEMERVFSQVKDEDLYLFGFNPKRFRPLSLILSIIPVMPPCSRPYVITDGEKCEDDLTTIYKDITKANAKILTAEDDTTRMKEVRSLSFYIAVLMDNSKGRAKQPTGRPKKSIKQRLAGKPGLFRGHLTGKRTNFSARTVVGGAPDLEADQVAVPTCISTRVTTPEAVCKFNLEKLSGIVNRGEAEFVIRTDVETGQKKRINLKIVTRTKTTPLFHGDRVFRQITKEYHNEESMKRDVWRKEIREKKEKTWMVKGELEVKIVELDQLHEGDTIIRRGTGEEVTAEVGRPRNFKLMLGDMVMRHLRDGDWVILNRQPTLHVGSILAARAVIQPFRRSIGIPLNDTTPQNCDFDGDEINLHMPQTLEAKAEYQELISVGQNIISGQSSRPIMGIVQDALVGSYLMTQGWVDIPENQFNDIIVSAKLEVERMDQIRRAYAEFKPEETQKRFDSLILDRLQNETDEEYEERRHRKSSLMYTGRGLLSFALPSTFHYTLHNKAMPTEPYLTVRNGVILEGSIDKSSVGPKSGAMHHYMNKTDALAFLTRIQHIVNNWIREQGFSVGIQDCFPTSYDESGMIPKVREEIEKCYLKAKVAETTQSNPVIAEIKVNAALNAARDVGQRIAKDDLPKSNRFLPLVLSGSKGSIGNITQILALVGGQNIRGQRLEETCMDGKRAFPHYDPEDDRPSKQYESRGFIRHSFFSGLNPHEFWAHAASSREGIINTACTTAKVGYCQRRITEMLKNLTVENDFTVRNTDGRIVQFVYGGDGVAPTKQHKQDGQLQLHLGTMIEAVNTQFEMDSYSQGTSMGAFRTAHHLKIEVDADLTGDKDLLSPVGSSGSGDGSGDSIGTPGSAEYDFDD